MANYSLPAYTGIRPKKPIDILFINLSNLPGRPVYPYAFVQVSALARRAGLSIVRWDGLELSLQHKLECITQLIKNYQPRTVAFTIRQADSVAADNYIRGFIFTQVPNWTALYRKNVLLIDTPHT
ncbi:MAG TPA: hypothetical protein V6C46_08760 [Coleofasciculaceae cyanobacterium]